MRCDLETADGGRDLIGAVRIILCDIISFSPLFLSTSSIDSTSSSPLTANKQEKHLEHSIGNTHLVNNINNVCCQVAI